VLALQHSPPRCSGQKGCDDDGRNVGVLFGTMNDADMISAPSSGGGSSKQQQQAVAAAASSKRS